MAGVEGDEEAAEVCTNYRYARRKAAATLKPGKGEDKPQGDQEAGDSKKKVAKPGKATTKGRGGKKGKEEDEKATAEAVEAERKAQEEAERKRLEQAAREAQRPKEYSPEEQDAYEKTADDMEQFFAGLTMREQEDPEAKSEGV